MLIPPRPSVRTISYGPIRAGAGSGSAARVTGASTPCPAVLSDWTGTPAGAK